MDGHFAVNEVCSELETLPRAVECPVLPEEKIMTTEKARDDELRTLGNQIRPHPYSAMDYSLDHLKKSVMSAPTGGTEFGEKVKGYAAKNIAATQEFVRGLSYANGIQDMSNSDGIYAGSNECLWRTG